MNSHDAQTLLRAHEKKNNCPYCGSLDHILQRCGVYEFHHDLGESQDPEWIKGREMVLARRKALAFGGIPELYLRNPDDSQVQKIRAYHAKKELELRAMVIGVDKVVEMMK